MKVLPNGPDYLPKQIMARLAWFINFSAMLDQLGSKYNIAQAIIDLVKANTITLTAVRDNLQLIDDFRTGLLKNRDSILLITTTNPDQKVELAKVPKLVDWAQAEVDQALVRPHIQAAELLVKNATLTDTDRTSFGLDKQPEKPSTRPTAEKYDYPLLTYKIENNMVKLRIVRGDLYKGKMCQIVMDATGSGKFTFLMFTVGQAVTVPIQVPTGLLANTMLFQAVYMDGNQTSGQWSPILFVPVQREAEPSMKEAEMVVAG